ncbi:MAG: hypothetical protein FWE34_07375 [Defluviitaleaceae bacterium]|nr:hypothetical protein [Defluviitaleaceae bacterium]
MENETRIEHSMSKGILLSLGGAIIGIVAWLAGVGLTGFGIGGALGGVFAAMLSGLVVGGYKKGKGAPGAVGVIVVAAITFLAATFVVFAGTTIIIFREGIGRDLFDAFTFLIDILGFDRTITNAFLFDYAVSVGIAVVFAIAAMVSKKKVAENNNDSIEEETKE